MMRPGVKPEYLLKLDTHKHTILMCACSVQDGADAQALHSYTMYIYIYIYVIALISPCHRGQVDGRFYARFGWDYVVAKYPKGTSYSPS